MIWSTELANPKIIPYQFTQRCIDSLRIARIRPRIRSPITQQIDPEPRCPALVMQQLVFDVDCYALFQPLTVPEQAPCLVHRYRFQLEARRSIGLPGNSLQNLPKKRLWTVRTAHHVLSRSLPHSLPEVYQSGNVLTRIAY